ncbi:rna polymerase ii-associated protein 3-like [Moniliophthora roreri MCA 2997]|uniref:Rna polymerase ii-associated protein 3-like n=1 Tax=Moniliophthora roreri (strain MCA 2997) TaxID=1381753 RepID=V2X3X0_MONRO|nr:rna polymerase ii-associated protein 3-like [Moniliophthora roreri MCA 2997]
MTPSEKAQIAKEKRNATFKSEDYPTAIGHYGAAIVEDRNDHTLPPNQAAAYLKLDKGGLEWEKLDEAKADFEAATKIEPRNQAVKDELGKIQVLTQKKASKTTAQLFGSSSAPDLRRRRVLIQNIEASQGTPSVSRGTTASAVDQESSPAPAPTPAPAPSTTSTTTDSPTETVSTPPKPSRTSNTYVRRRDHPLAWAAVSFVFRAKTRYSTRKRVT